MKKIIYTASGTFPGHKLRGKERYQKLYHYTSFDTFVKIWLSKQLRYSLVSNVNDIQEAETSISARPNQMAVLYAYKEIRLKYKQISFTMDFDSYMKGCMSPMMWGHYGGKRNGVCIELDYTKLNLPKTSFAAPVRYRQVLKKSQFIDSGICTIKQIKNFIKAHKTDIFFTKQKCWAGENEYRVVSAVDDYLYIGDAITAVYLTSYNSTECLLTERLVGDSIPVRFIQYIGSTTNMALPIISDTRRTRKQLDCAKANPENALNIITQNARSVYESHKEDENFDLTIT